MNKLVTNLVLLVVLFLGSSSPTTGSVIRHQTDKSLDGYKLVKVTPRTVEHSNLLKLWNEEEEDPELEILSGSLHLLNRPVMYLVSPKRLETFVEQLDEKHVSYRVVNHNVYMTIMEQRAEMAATRQDEKKLEEQKKMRAKVQLKMAVVEADDESNDENKKFDGEAENSGPGSLKEARNTVLGKYARYPEILNYINKLVEENGKNRKKNSNKQEQQNNLIITSYVAGSTYEQRQVRILEIKSNSSQRAVWLDCGIHAREWISPATCIWFIDSLINNYMAGEAKAVELIHYYSFHVAPLLNPDGYEYSHNTFRMWRKNRSPNDDSFCAGTDLNRNFDFKWRTGGSSDNKCADSYAGPDAASEYEIKSIEQAVRAKLTKWDSFMSVHSYGEVWLLPWAYTEERPDDYSDLLEVSRASVNALSAINGQTYVIESPTNIFGITTGSAMDWAKAKMGIKYSFGLELPPSREDDTGVLLPESRIPGVGNETYAGLIEMYRQIKRKTQTN